MQDSNVKINVTYIDPDSLVELRVSGFASIIPLNDISKQDMGLQLAMDIATRNAGREKVTIISYNIEEI